MFRELLKRIGLTLKSIHAGIVAGVIGSIVAIFNVSKMTGFSINNTGEFIQTTLYYSGLVILLAVMSELGFRGLGNVFIWLSKYRPRIKHARLGLDFLEKSKKNEWLEKEIFLVFHNAERRLDASQVEVTLDWAKPLPNEDGQVNISKHDLQQIEHWITVGGKMKWKLDDGVVDASNVSIPRRKDKHLYFLETSAGRNEFYVKTIDRDLGGFPSGEYEFSMCIGGDMPKRIIFWHIVVVVSYKGKDQAEIKEIRNGF